MKKHSLLILALICFVIFSILLSLCKGSMYIPFDQLLFSHNDVFQIILLDLRLPRTLTAFVCGGLLALAGSLIQLLLQNPLADPYVLGVSGGAAMAALALMLLGVAENWLIPGAWLGGLLTILIIFLLSRRHHWQTHRLLLLGITLAGGYSACISLILLLSPEKKLHSMLFWLAGDLNEAKMPWSGLLILFFGSFLCWWLAPGLNILTRGEKEARALGLPVKRYRMALYLLSSLFTAASVVLSGCIGFIGLMIPHLTRLLIGSNYRLILPFATLLGGSLLSLADTCARSLFAPQQLPVGMLLTMLGVPIFIWLLR